jgi:hypothetical protein
VLTQKVAALQSRPPSVLDIHQGRALDRDEVQLMIQQVSLFSAKLSSSIVELIVSAGFERLRIQTFTFFKFEWDE